MAGKKRRISTAATKSSDSPDETRTVKKARVPVDALAVPELLSDVLFFATQSTLKSCARVCKQWSEVALDGLWKHLDSVFPLLELVMSSELLRNLALGAPNASQILSSELSSAEWSRFQYYSSRARSMSYDCEKCYRPNSIPPAIAPEAIAMLCLYRPSGLEMLPRLETLKWFTNGPITPIIPFLSARIESLEVNLMGDSQSVHDFFCALVGRTPHLRAFTLRTPTRVMDIEGALRKAIDTWKNLEVLVLPSYYLRPSILGVVASLPNLTNLNPDYTYDQMYDEAATLQELPENAFPKLRSFSFNCNPLSAQRLAVKHSDLFTGLASIHIDAANSVGDEEVLKFVHHLGRKCGQLGHISLNLCMGLGPQGEVTSPLSLRVLESLFPCRQLIALVISHPYPLTIAEADVQRMAVAWPRLKIFDVCNEPDLSLSIPRDMGNSLSILPTFASHFPMMKGLGLFFAQDQNLSFSGNLYPKFEFHQLEKLGVGVSAVPKGRSQDVGFLIASLCRVEPTIDIGVSGWFVGPWCPALDENQCQWDEVEKFLQFAMRIKIASRTDWSNAAA